MLHSLEIYILTDNVFGKVIIVIKNSYIKHDETCIKKEGVPNTCVLSRYQTVLLDVCIVLFALVE